MLESTVTATKAETTLKGRVISGWRTIIVQWNLVVNEILGKIDRQGCKVGGYADDLMIVVRGQRTQRKVEGWFAKTGLSVISKKTKPWCAQVEQRL